MIDKAEAYRLLYKFLKEEGLLQTYCARVQENRLHNSTCNMKGWNAKEILQDVIFQYLRHESSLVGCCARCDSAFSWAATKEGHDYWNKVYEKWEHFLRSKNLGRELIRREI